MNKRIPMAFAILILPLAFFLSLTNRVQATPASTVTVCATGCDYTTIQAAINAVSAGTTIQVTDAVHTESGITVNKQVIIAGQGSQNTWIQAAATSGTANDGVFSISTNTHVTIRNLLIRHGKRSLGGGVINQGHLTLENVTIANNEATSGGGGIDQERGTLILRNSTVQSNSAGVNGGGIRMTGGGALIVDTQILQNSAASSGGGIGVVNGKAYISIQRTTVNNNSATFGGGISSDHSNNHVQIVNSTIVKNNTRSGVDNSGTMIIRNSTLADNNILGSPSTSLTNDNFGTLTIKNSIVTNIPLHDACANSGTFSVDGAPNLSNDATCPSFTLTNSDPALSALADLGGPTPTVQPAFLSDAVDVGSNCELYDQRGIERGNDLGCDLGAYELVLNESCVYPNLPIPDNQPSGTTSNLLAPSSGTIVTSVVSIFTTHSWVSDLTFDLASGGQTVSLIDRAGIPATINGCGGDDIAVRLDSTASTAVEDQCEVTSPALRGSVRPNQSLSAFTGQLFSNPWVLTIADHAGSDTGILNQWCVQADLYDPAPSKNDPIKDLFVIVSQPAIGPGDSFYYLVEMTTAAVLTTTSAPFQVVFNISGGQTVNWGTPIVPAGTGYSCFGAANVGGCSLGTIEASTTYRFYFPMENPNSRAACTTGNVSMRPWSTTFPFSQYMDSADAPICKPTSQGSTTITAPTPLAVGLAERGVASAEINISQLLFLMLATLLSITIWRKRI